MVLTAAEQQAEQERMWKDAARMWSEQLAFDFLGTLPRGRARADIHGMTYPMYAMKAGDKRLLQFNDSRTGKTITVRPSHLGRVTIDDRDLLIFLLSVVNENYRKDPAAWEHPRPVRFAVREFMEFTGRKIGGGQYKALKPMLTRLHQTTIETDLATQDETEWQAFSLITEPKLTAKGGRGRGNSTIVEVCLCSWLHRAVIGGTVLQINKDYFGLAPYEKRLYELVRRHMGNSDEWPIGLDRLYELMGEHVMVRRKFAAFLRGLATTQPLPEFFLDLPLDGTTGKPVVGSQLVWRRKKSASLLKALRQKTEYT